MRAINDAAAKASQSQYVNSKEKKAKDAAKPDSGKSGSSVVKDEVNTISAIPVSRASSGKSPISDEAMLKRVVEFARKGMLSDPSTASEAHKNITPQNVLQLIG